MAYAYCKTCKKSIGGEKSYTKALKDANDHQEANPGHETDVIRTNS